MNYYRKEEPMKVSKKGKILSNICKECDRYKMISINFCNDCWKEMNRTFTEKENSNG